MKGLRIVQVELLAHSLMKMYGHDLFPELSFMVMIKQMHFEADITAVLKLFNIEHTFISKGAIQQADGINPLRRYKFHLLFYPDRISRKARVSASGMSVFQRPHDDIEMVEIGIGPLYSTFMQRLSDGSRTYRF